MCTFEILSEYKMQWYSHNVSLVAYLTVFFSKFWFTKSKLIKMSLKFIWDWKIVGIFLSIKINIKIVDSNILTVYYKDFAVSLICSDRAMSYKEHNSKPKCTVKSLILDAPNHKT